MIYILYIISYIYTVYIYQCYIVPTWHEAVSSKRLQAATEYRRDVTERKVAAALGDSVAAAKQPNSQASEAWLSGVFTGKSEQFLQFFLKHSTSILLAYYWHTGMPKYDLEETPIYEIYMFKK